MKASIVDLTVEHGAQATITDRQHPHPPGVEIGLELLMTRDIQIVKTNEQDVRLRRVRVQPGTGQISEPLGELLTTAVIIGESLDAVSECDQSRCLNKVTSVM